MSSVSQNEYRKYIYYFFFSRSLFNLRVIFFCDHTEEDFKLIFSKMRTLTKYGFIIFCSLLNFLRMPLLNPSHNFNMVLFILLANMR